MNKLIKETESSLNRGVDSPTIDLNQNNILLSITNWDAFWNGVTKYHKAKPKRNDPITMMLHRDGNSLKGIVTRSWEKSKRLHLSDEVRGTLGLRDTYPYR